MKFTDFIIRIMNCWSFRNIVDFNFCLYHNDQSAKCLFLSLIFSRTKALLERLTMGKDLLAGFCSCYCFLLCIHVIMENIVYSFSIISFSFSHFTYTQNIQQVLIYNFFRPVCHFTLSVQTSKCRDWTTILNVANKETHRCHPPPNSNIWDPFNSSKMIAQ